VFHRRLASAAAWQVTRVPRKRSVIAPSRAPVHTISCGSDGKEGRNYCMRHANEAHVSPTTMEYVMGLGNVDSMRKGRRRVRLD
jgi:hypothetical protein